jgi:predicted  nucleic acid-binding Zn-ribbon protein
MLMASKAEQIWDQINERVEAGATKAEAFAALAERYRQPVNSMRGAYYAHKRKLDGGSSRTRRRETTSADAVESAKTALRRGIEAIDREVETARERAEAATAEATAMEESAPARKAEIESKIAALES